MSSSEKRVEKLLSEEVLKLNGVAYKFTSPGHNGVPDRLIVLPYGVHAFVEGKDIGKGLDPPQERERDFLVDRGHVHRVVRSTWDVKMFIEFMKQIMELRK